MSAFLSIISSNKLVLMSDAATYTDDGVLTCIDSKVYELPNMNAVMTNIGTAELPAHILNFMIERIPATFDEFLAVLPHEIEAFECSQEGQAFWNKNPKLYQLFVAGWSECRAAPVAFHIFGCDMPVRPDMPGQRPYRLMKSRPVEVEGPQSEVPEAFLQWLDDVAIGRSSLDSFDPKALGIRCFEAMRWAKSPLIKNPKGESIHLVGGFVDLFEIDAFGVKRSVVKKWDDRVGEKIDPSRSPRPEFYGVPTFAHMPRARANNGLSNTSGGAFATIQKAIDIIASTIDIAGFNVTIQVGDGTYTDPIILKNVVGFSAAGNLVIQGNNGTPANVVISTSASASTFMADGISSIWDLKDLKIQNSGASSSYGISAQSGARVRFGNIDFGACAAGHLNAFGPGSVITALSNYKVSGGGARHFQAFYGAQIVSPFLTVTISNTPNFTIAWADVEVLGSCQVHGMTFSGSATGSRYKITNGATLFTNGQATTYLPGNAAGTGTNFATAPYGLYA